MTIAVRPQTVHLDKTMVVHVDMTILLIISPVICIYTFLLKLIKQFQQYNTGVN